MSRLGGERRDAMPNAASMDVHTLQRHTNRDQMGASHPWRFMGMSDYQNTMYLVCFCVGELVEHRERMEKRCAFHYPQSEEDAPLRSTRDKGDKPILVRRVKRDGFRLKM